MSIAGRYFTFLDEGPVHVWHHRDNVAIRVGVPAAADNPSTHVLFEPNETLEGALVRSFPAWFRDPGRNKVRDMVLAPGQFYRRMARPSDQHPEDTPGSNPGAEEYYDELAVMRGQLITLMQALIGICQVVHPEAHTWQAYGHEIRNTLILASTEVEAHWRSVLIANGYYRKRFTTSDYVRLQGAMKLGEFAVSLPYYPWLPPIRPFANWGTSSRTTADLSWYEAYNAVKHDREGSFSQATLENAINAVVACAVMLVAQFGESEAFRWRTEFGYFFRLSSAPLWDRSEVYTYPYPTSGRTREAVLYPFS